MVQNTIDGQCKNESLDLLSDLIVLANIPVGAGEVLTPEFLGDIERKMSRTSGCLKSFSPSERKAVDLAILDMRQTLKDEKELTHEFTDRLSGIINRMALELSSRKVEVMHLHFTE